MKKNLITIKKLMVLMVMALTIMAMSQTVETQAATKKYTKTYTLKRKAVKSLKYKRTVKSVKSSNKKVASVKKMDKLVYITAKKKGTAIITVTFDNKKVYKYRIKVSSKKHTHKWKNSKKVPKLVHHEAEYVNEEHCVASDGHDFGPMATCDWDEVAMYCWDHKCSYGNDVVRVKKDAYDELTYVRGKKCTSCSAYKIK